MRLNYIMTRAALLQGVRLQMNAPMVALMTGGAFFVVMAVERLSSGAPPRSAACFALWLLPTLLAGLAFGPGLSLLMWLLILPFRVWMVHRQNPLLYGATELVADDQGFKLQTPSTTANFAWTDLHGFKESRPVFGLNLSKSASFTVPKEGLSPEQVSDFRNLLASHLKRLR